MSGATASALQNIKKEQQERFFNLGLQLITGGGEPPSGNWLIDLPVGAIFTVMDAKNFDNFMAARFEVVYKTPQTVRLWSAPLEDPNGGVYFGDVVPNRFTARFTKLEVELPKEEEKINGNSDRVQGEPEPA